MCKSIARICVAGVLLGSRRWFVQSPHWAPRCQHSRRTERNLWQFVKDNETSQGPGIGCRNFKLFRFCMWFELTVLSIGWRLERHVVATRSLVVVSLGTAPRTDGCESGFHLFTCLALSMPCMLAWRCTKTKLWCVSECSWGTYLCWPVLHWARVQIQSVLKWVALGIWKGSCPTEGNKKKTFFLSSSKLRVVKVTRNKWN